MKRMLICAIVALFSNFTYSQNDIAEKLTSGTYNGKYWQTYTDDNLFVSCAIQETGHGKIGGNMYRVFLVIVNGTNHDVFFNGNVTGIKMKGDDMEILETFTQSQMQEKFRRWAAWEAGLFTFAQGVSNMNKNYYRTSTSTSTTYYNYCSNYSGTVSIMDLYGNSAEIMYDGTESGSGQITTTTTTTYYDKEAEERDRIELNRRVKDFCDGLKYRYDYQQLGYLTSNNMRPGESISGYVYIDRPRRIDNLYIGLYLNEKKYFFGWGK